MRPETGGSTPILRSDLVLDWILEKHPDIAAKFEGGVRYIRRVPQVDDASSAIGRSWRSMFKVEIREDAEQKMAESHYEHEWI